MVTFESVQTYVDFLIKAQNDGMGNVPQFAKVEKGEYESLKEKVDYWQYVQFADHHYFVARILFLYHDALYSKFCSYQCIENYLKAILKLNGQTPRDTHELKTLLKECRSLNLNSDFLDGKRIELIIDMYLPFYEISRYPVGKNSPGLFNATLIPDDIYVLDYFVFKAREIIPKQDSGAWNILEGTHYHLFMLIEKFPEVLDLFKKNNINFTVQKPATV